MQILYAQSRLFYSYTTYVKLRDLRSNVPVVAIIRSKLSRWTSQVISDEFMGQGGIDAIR